jgi:hypothetical protein
MRRDSVFAISLLSLLLAGISASAQTSENSADTLSPAVEKCIRDNAADVESTVPDLNEAVTFLVGDLCAKPISEEQRRRSQAAADETEVATKKHCDELQAKKNPTKFETSELQVCSISATHIGFVGLEQYTQDMVVSQPASATSLAAQLLLQLRLAHSKSGQVH